MMYLPHDVNLGHFVKVVSAGFFHYYYFSLTIENYLEGDILTLCKYPISPQINFSLFLAAIMITMILVTDDLKIKRHISLIMIYLNKKCKFKSVHIF